MPAKSAAQKRLMDAAAHNPAFAKKVGIPSKVAKEYSEASKGSTFKRGGEMKESKAMELRHVAAMKKAKVPSKIVREEQAEADAMKRGGKVKKLASGGLAAGHKTADGVAKKGKTKGIEVKMKKGGKCK